MSFFNKRSRKSIFKSRNITGFIRKIGDIKQKITVENKMSGQYEITIE